MQINVEGAFCRASRMTIAPLSLINVGIGIINEILMRELLCRHDVEYINKLYTVMEKMSDFDRKKVLQDLAPRIRQLSKDDSSKGKISFYYLQILGHNDLRSVSEEQNFSKVSSNLEEIASLLPICSNEEEFEKDIATLIGIGSADRLKILSYKREQVKQLQEKKRVISSKKVELEALKRTAPYKIPDYMSELLENGHIQLFDHLVEMMKLPERNSRKLAIGNLTFSQISHIVLQTRDAIIQKVESYIQNHNKQVLFLLGPSGSGKSTTLCALRGDVMKFEKGHYVSENDFKDLIGYDGSFSCTFLPTVVDVQGKGCFIVDFAGFEDTNGPLVSLGMECALKELVEKHNPSILVLEPITDTEGRFAHVARLAHMLGRLFNDTTKCILGITKYSNDPDYTHIQILERTEREKLLAPTQEEKDLMTEIKCLKKYELDFAEKEKELADLQSRQPKKEPLIIDTHDIRKHKENLIYKEVQLIQNSGMKKVVRLQNLEDPQQAAQIFNEIMMLSEPVSVCENHQLDPEDRELLNKIFTKTLFAEIEKDDYSNEDFYAFERSVLEYSLTKTLKARSNPEIGRFLHLPQLDPMIVRHYDQEIVDRCITKYMNFVIKTIHISLIDKLCNENSEIGSKQKKEELQNKIAELKNYVMQTLTGISFVDDPVRAEEEWNKIKRKLNSATTSVQVQLPAWANFFKISDTVFNRIYDWLEGRFQQQAYLEASDNMIDECCTEVDNMYGTLLRLNDIKIMIEKQNDIDNAFSSENISIESFSDFHLSIKQRITAVANVYGINWDKRVEFIFQRLSLKGFNRTDKNHLNCLLGYAYWLMEPDVRCIYQIEIDLGVVESVNAGVKKMAEDLHDILSVFPFLNGDMSWKSIGINFNEIACNLRKIESAAHREIEGGIEFFLQNENITQSEILRSFANAVGDAASFAEILAKPYEGNADISTLRKKIDIAFSLAKLNAPVKALVSSWSSWSKAGIKAAQVDQRTDSKEQFNYKLTFLKKVGSLNGEPTKVEICSKSGLFELDKRIRERRNTNRPLVRALFAATLLRVYNNQNI